MLAIAPVGGCSKQDKSSKSTDATATNPATPSTTTPAKTEPAKPAPKLDEKTAAMIAELTEKFESFDSVSVKLNTDLEQAAGGKGTTLGRNGEYDTKKQDGKRLISFWITNTLYISAPEKEYVTMEIVDDLYDGEYLYKTLRQNKLNRITKKHYSPELILQLGGKNLLEPLVRDNELKFVGEEVLKERPSYVFEAKPVAGGWNSKQWFDKETGVRTKLIESDETGAQKVSIEVLEIKVNSEIKADRFSAKAYPGFEFIDETAPIPPTP